MTNHSLYVTDRLEQSKKVISDLEARARDLERQNATLPELLDQMRRKTEADLQNYKKDVEAANNKNVRNKIISLDFCFCLDSGPRRIATYFT